jgi:hypothetical protein
MAHQGDGEQLAITAAGRQPRPWRDRDCPGSDQIIDQHVDIDEQVLG